MKKIILIAIIAFLVLAIYQLVLQIRDSMESIEKSTTLQEQYDENLKKNAFLKERLEFVQTDEFINEQARNELGLVQKDEYIVLAPPPEGREFEEILDKTPNWKKWLDLLF